MEALIVTGELTLSALLLTLTCSRHVTQTDGKAAFIGSAPSCWRGIYGINSIRDGGLGFGVGGWAGRVVSRWLLFVFGFY